MTKENTEPVSGRHAGLAFGLVFLLLAAGILTGGFFYYWNYERKLRAAGERQLSAIAELKVSELVQYRKERLGDAGIFRGNPAFAQLVRGLLDHQADAQRQLEDWLGKFSKLVDYEQAWLLDEHGAVVLTVPAGPQVPCDGVVRAASGVLATGRPAIYDFHRDDPDGRVFMAVLVPVHDAGGDRPLGVVVLRINPATYLYPFIQRWPTPSGTAETLLVRREGNEAVFLNELRFRSGAALTLRAPLENRQLPAAMVVAGREGIMEGVDYRGVAVLAAMRAIPDSPWFLVAKMDIAEVDGALREKIWQTVLMIGVLLFGAGAGMGVIWRQQRVRFFRDQARLEKTLRLSEATLQVAMDQSPVGIAIADAPDGALRYVNDAGLMIRGGDRAAIVEGVGIRQYVASWRLMDLDGRELAADEVPLARAILFGEESVREFIIRRDDNADRLGLAKAAPVKDEHGRVVAGIVVFMDITERRETEAQLRHIMADLKRSNQELEQFASVASHDLQEPLRMVASYTQLLAQRYEGQLDDKAQKYIRYAVDGAVRMQTLINDLLSYSRVGMAELTRESVDSHAVLGEALVNLCSVIEEHRAIITNGDLPRVSANASQLAQVFQNLLSNAIKFRGEDLPHIHVAAEDRGREWRFSVKDNGIGIDPRHAARVFVIFQRLHTREEYPGTGIGLAICQRIVERHGGKIWFESQPGQGATFFFTIPK